jgi:hypothetical protein
MTTRHKPFSLGYDPETTRPGEQIHAAPDPLGDDFARRLRDIERAGRLRSRAYSASFGAAECAHFCRFALRDHERAAAYERAAEFFGRLYTKACQLERRARGEAS